MIGDCNIFGPVWGAKGPGLSDMFVSAAVCGDHRPAVCEQLPVHPGQPWRPREWERGLDPGEDGEGDVYRHHGQNEGHGQRQQGGGGGRGSGRHGELSEPPSCKNWHHSHLKSGGRGRVRFFLFSTSIYHVDTPNRHRFGFELLLHGLQHIEKDHELCPSISNRSKSGSQEIHFYSGVSTCEFPVIVQNDKSDKCDMYW